MTARALVPVILAGGIGTRLWPVSRETMPKHLARLVGDESLLQQTARRLIALAPPERVVTVGAGAQDFLVARQLAEVDPGLVRHRLLEPVGRNTAAAIAPGRALCPSAARSRCGAVGMSLGPSRARSGGARACARDGAAGRRRRRAGHLRHHADPRRDRLRLRPRGRPAGERAEGARGDAVRREAAAGDGGSHAGGGRSLLEQRHVRVPGRSHPRRARAARPRHPARGRGGVRSTRRSAGRRLAGPARALPGGAGAPDRPGGHGAHRPDRAGAVRSRLVGSRLVAGALGAAAQGCGRQRGARRRRARRRQGLPGAGRAAPGRLRRRARPRRGRDRRRGAGHRSGALRGDPRAGELAEGRRSQPGQRPWRGAAPVGPLQGAARGAGLQGQGDRGGTRRPAQPAKPPPSRRALGGGRRHGQDHGRRRGSGPAARTRASTFRSAPGIGWRIRARCRCT